MRGGIAIAVMKYIVILAVQVVDAGGIDWWCLF
jgi:hypothetical protein